MKKLFSLLIVALFATHTVLADDVSREQALQIACQFAASPSTQQLSRRSAPAQPATPQVAYTMQSKVAAGKDNVYVINLGSNQGFVLISGESGTDGEVLGYCDHGSFSYNDCPIQMKDLLDAYSDGIDSLRQDPAMATPRRAQYESYLGTVVVEPLITSTWNQWAPYNQQCPEATSESTDPMGYMYGGRCPTGCVPTAIAQVMRYWRWPEVTTGTVSGQDFSGHTYDWDNMLDDYSHGCNAAQAEAVAKLMADVGAAMRTQYGPNGSPTYFQTLALVENFGYQPDCSEVTGSTAYSLKSRIIYELQERRPVPYAGNPGQGDSHALVCDGYTGNDYFHFNYGWGGYYDGWYKLSVLPMYRRNVCIWTNFRPYNAIKKVIDGIEYGLLSHGEAEIISYAAGAVGQENGELIIPATVENEGKTYKVTRIRQQSFERKGSFTKLVMGDNIKTIDPGSFFNNRIDTLVLSDQMEMVPDEAFKINNIYNLTIGKNVKRIGKRAFFLCPLGRIISRSPAFEVDEEAFMNTKPAAGDWTNCITSLGRRAFYGAKLNMRQSRFNNLEVIGDSAFALSSFGDKAADITIGPKVKQLSPSAFDRMHYSSVIHVDENNPYFSTMGSPTSNIVYNKDKTSIILATGFVKENDFAPTVLKMEPNCLRPDYKYYNIIPSSVVEMTGAFRDYKDVGEYVCLSVVPPVMTDDSFNEESLETVRQSCLHVPAGTEEAYRTAPGWRLFKEVVGDREYNPLPAQQREYYMVVDGTDSDQHRLSIPLSDVNSMELTDDGRHVVIKRNGKEDFKTTVAAVDSITWRPGFVYENAEVFDLNDSTLTVQAQKCSVRFDATVIDDDVQLCVRNSVLTPNVQEGVKRGFGIDFSLSNGQHQLDGTADIIVPFTATTDEEVCAAYYNEETDEWEPVCYTYDRMKGTITLTTDHLSEFVFYAIDNNGRAYSSLNLFKMPEPLYNLKEGLTKLLKIVSSEHPDVEWLYTFKDEMALWQSVGLDGLWSIVRGAGEPLFDFRPEAIDNAVTLMGYLGLALTIFDVARADASGDDIAVASGTLKTILSYSNMLIGTQIGTPVLTLAMGWTAFIGIALEKFGTKVQEIKHDNYSRVYHFFYSRRGKDQGSCYRSAQDWYRLLYPVVSEGNMTQEQFKQYLWDQVQEYSNQIWDDKYSEVYEGCYGILGIRFPGTTLAYPEEKMKRQLSEEHFAELLSGELESVVTAIKNHVKVEACKRYEKALKDVADMVNTQILLRFVDSSCKKGEVSKYANWWVRFTDISGSLPKPGDFKRYITEKGTASMGVTIYSLLQNGMRAHLTLSDPDGEDQKCFDFQIPMGVGKVYVTIDIDKGGVKADTKPLEGLELTYDPNVVQYPSVMGEGGGMQTETGLIYLDNAANERARFQTGIEQFFNRHDFVTVDKQGNYKIGDDITGSFPGNGLEATGTCVIDVSYKYIEKTKEQFVREVANPDRRLLWTSGLLDGIIQHRIECTYKITRKSTDSNEFEITYTGTGAYALLANIISKVNGDVDVQALVDGVGQEISAADLVTDQVSFEGNVTLKYTAKIK